MVALHNNLSGTTPEFPIFLPSISPCLPYCSFPHYMPCTAAVLVLHENITMPLILLLRQLPAAGAPPSLCKSRSIPLSVHLSSSCSAASMDSPKSTSPSSTTTSCPSGRSISACSFFGHSMAALQNPRDGGRGGITSEKRRK